MPRAKSSTAKPKRKRGSPAFIASMDDIRRYKILKAAGVKDELIRNVIFNPATGKSISKEAFYRVFKPYSGISKTELVVKALSVWIAPLDDDKANFLIKDRCASQVMKYMTRGIFDDRFDLDQTTPYEDQLDQISSAVNSGKIFAYEAEPMIKAIQVKLDKQYREAELAAEQEREDTGDVSININGAVAQSLNDISTQKDKVDHDSAPDTD